MNRQELDPALAAANVALAGRHRREASSFASIELRSAKPDDGRWELVAAATVGFIALVAVFATWLY
jgi:hypothetical protein